jgi:hypothetical protein
MNAPLLALDDLLDELWRDEVASSRRRARIIPTRANIMPQRVHLDAMIPREDFAVEGKEFVLDLFPSLRIADLVSDSPILKLLRKPDFQRETNHWTPEQVCTFVQSFLDNEVIPSLILWKSPNFIFAIDGGHRLSALRAWMEDDYGDLTISGVFYSGAISKEQKRIANRTRKLIESKIGRFSTLRGLVESGGNSEQERRAKLLFTRVITVQWVQGTAAAAESSFYKINTQGTPLDEIEEMLIRNRRKPIAISARAILRAGSGHKYWSSFPLETRDVIEKISHDLFNLLFEPESDPPIKTLDLPFGGALSPLDALSVLVEFLTITTGEEESVSARRGAPEKQRLRTIGEYSDDPDGTDTIEVLTKALEILSRITGNSHGSLGLHPAVYFYNEQGKHSRFLFLAMTMLIAEKLRNNDGVFFQKFTKARAGLETFLIENKSLIGILLQNMSRGQRVPNTRDLLAYLVAEFSVGNAVTPVMAIARLGLRGRVFDVDAAHPTYFSDDVKSMAFIQKALESALKCPICEGRLDPNKSVSYDHKVPLRDGGGGGVENAQLVHPYCNTAVKS